MTEQRHYLRPLCVCGIEASISADHPITVEMMVNDWWREHAKACIFARQTLRELEQPVASADPSPGAVRARLESLSSRVSRLEKARFGRARSFVDPKQQLYEHMMELAVHADKAQEGGETPSSLSSWTFMGYHVQLHLVRPPE